MVGGMLKSWIVAVAVGVMTLLPLAAHSQSAKPATLIADDIQLTRDNKLIANGNVEAFQNGQILRASRITYDRANGKLIIEGPIVIDDGKTLVTIADQAELDEGFENGILRGARIVIDQQLQLAAVEMNRVGGRYNQLYKVAATACRICENDPTPPFWQIRAKRVVHDTEEKQLYFDNAQLRILGVPVMYLPRLRLPDPTLERATGFLIPSLFTTSRLGTGVKVPYFIRLGDHRDLTLTPFLSANTRTLEFRYRQKFRRGGITAIGAITRDDLQPGNDRGYLFAVGRFDLKRDFVLDFDIEATSDNAYLDQYDYSDKDRLDSEVRISRARRDQYVAASFINLKTLRDDEDNDTIPTNVVEATFEQRFFPKALGGELRLSALAHAHERRSTALTDGSDADSIVDGRDVYRANATVDWRRNWTLASGVQLQTELGFAADVFNINQDPAFTDSQTQVTPFGAVSLRYPLVRYDSGGVVHHVEPVVQLGWTGGEDLNIPNEESTRPEFDEGNLLALSRFATNDRRERGTVLAYGVSWSRTAPDGWDSAFTIGQVLRSEADADFTKTSGLSATSSHFLVAGELRMNAGLSVTGRSIFNENFDVAKTELRGDWRFKKIALSGSYVYLTSDPDEDRANANSELDLNGVFALDKHWSLSAGTRYDFDDGRTATANVGIAYENECVLMKFRVLREYATSASVEPTTNVGFTVALNGFSSQAGGKTYTRSCKGHT
ncbi:MAG: LPS-assembly protein LptD [Rhodobacteraceae bacterium]|nr:LPS-assembly protein LptD [Paracoccaceae bacterium]